ncbi:MAG: hypothetical protein GXY83_16020 [Rhodopirellula sp.]|nr:hypothetical protein [Rhodopirellula sp.]
MSNFHDFCLAVVIAILAITLTFLSTTAAEPISVSGRYPHLAVFNHGDECGIGAVVVWAGKLWAVTYPPHAPRGSDDKLYCIDDALNLAAFEGSIGGTPANRMIHRESKQLIIGPYFIDTDGNVRVVPYGEAPGRPTATARHLTDPRNKVYQFTMEEGLYEIDVHSLEVTTIQPDGHQKGFVDRLPGYHGKGGYTGQGRLVIGNNGSKERPYATIYGNSGCLAEWDGNDWKTVVEKQFCEVTGPGGIEGNPDKDAPLWATGWDKRSVLLKLLDGGVWHTFRLPIGDYSYVAKHGWFTEWPRIREVVPAQDGQPPKLLMNMHGLWFDFPQGFRHGHTGGLRPIAGYLKVTGDFCPFNGRIVFGCDDTAITGGNRFVNQSQSNFWFSSWQGLHDCGRPAGWGGPWFADDVASGESSEPYLLAGFDKRVLHLSHESAVPVEFVIETSRGDASGWQEIEKIEVPAKGYRYVVLRDDIPGDWIRLRPTADAVAATAYFHYGPGGGTLSAPSLFASLADAGDISPQSIGIIRPRGGDQGTLQMLAYRTAEDHRQPLEPIYYEIGPDMQFQPIAEPDDSRAFLEKTAALGAPDFQVDAASVIVTRGDQRFHLPKTDAAYDEPWAIGWPRGIREVVTERRLFNCHGTFYVLPHEAAGDVAALKPVCTHGKRITDFCSWRGMLVLAGVRGNAEADDHTFVSDDGRAAVWCGDIDDLWKLGKPRGHGGPWKDTAVEAGKPSDPYLMTGFDRKRVELSHSSPQPVTVTIEVDFLRNGTWKTYQQITVAAGKTVAHEFPDGFSAHWVRVTADQPCVATAWFVYE